MNGNWKVTTKDVAGTTFYQVYRARDLCAPLEQKNIETTGGLWATEEEAEALARRLNIEEAVK